MREGESRPLGPTRSEDRVPAAAPGSLLDRARRTLSRLGLAVAGGPSRLAADDPAAQTRALLAAVVQSSDDAIVTKTLDGIITSWNAGAERLFGYGAEEAVGRPITLIIPPERYDEERRVLAQLRRGARIEPFDTVRVTRSGLPVEVSLRISPIRDPSGRIVGASKLARDVGEVRRAERALKEIEGRFRAVATNAPAAIFIKDLEGVYTLANPLAMEALGRQDTVVGLSDYDLLPRSNADAIREVDRKVVETGAPIEIEEEIRRPGYFRRFLSVKFPLPDAAGDPAGVCGVALDITDRKRAEEALQESEERFRTMADNIAQFAWMADGDGWIFWYNQRWFEYTGTTLEEMEGWGWRAVHHPDHVDRVVEKISRCFESGEAWEDTFPLRAADGSYRWFLSRAVPIRDEDGDVTRWFGTNTDVTDRLEAEQALKEADRRKDEFLATLAHELRNPLAPIRNSVEILREVEGDPALRERGHAILDRQIAHLERLVDDLLDVARISGGRLMLRKERMDLAAAIEQAMEMCRPKADARGLDLRFEPAATALPIDGDGVRLTQVFGNLLSNACKFTESGGRVELLAWREGDEAVVSVRDSGRGIPAEMLPRVFDMFSQHERGGAGDRGGLGIGLSLVRRLVQMHGGRVDAASAGPDQGSEFSVRLPLAQTPAPAAPSPPRRSDEPQSALRILVVDDNVDAAESLAMLLDRSGHQTRIAYDGDAAIELARALRPQAVLLDIGLPKRDGNEVARWIRDQPWGGEVTLVALTGWGQEEARRSTEEAGFDHHLLKPVDLAELKELLRGTAEAGGSGPAGATSG